MPFPVAVDNRKFAMVAFACASVFTSLMICFGDGAGLWDFPLDDAWIHLVYTRGLLTDGAPTYNAGIPEVGFSSPLWMLAAIPGYLIGQAVGFLPLVIKITSAFWGIVAAVGAARTAVQLSRKTAAGYWTILLLSAWPMFSFAAASGMEVTLCTALLFWAFSCRFGARHRSAGALLALATLARPEAAVVPVVFAVWEIAASSPRHAAIRRTALTIGPTVVAGGAWTVYNYSVSGYFLPNTFYVKADAAGLHNLKALVPELLLGSTPITGIVLPLLVVAALGLVVFKRAREAAGPSLLVAVVGAVGLVGVLSTRRVLYNVSFYQLRYYLPFAALFIPLCVSVLCNASVRRVVCVSVSAVFLIACGFTLPRSLEMYRAHCDAIRALHTGPALYVKDHTPSDAAIAVEGAGAAAFFSERFVVDLNGLNTGMIAHSKDGTGLVCALARYRPTMTVIPEKWQSRIEKLFEIQAGVQFRYEAPAPYAAELDGAVDVSNVRLRPEVYRLCAE